MPNFQDALSKFIWWENILTFFNSMQNANYCKRVINYIFSNETKYRNRNISFAHENIILELRSRNLHIAETGKNRKKNRRYVASSMRSYDRCKQCLINDISQ